MENRIKIDSISIKNFRSIKNITIDVSDMNVFVGLNDAGKSNIIKALNLFFNNRTDYDKEFVFDRDFTYLWKEKSHEAQEIKVAIKLRLPSTYSEKGQITWIKTWRRNAPYQEFILDEDGNPISTRKKTRNALYRIKFRYVPAVKSKEFYKYLLSELYISAASSLNSPLVDSTKEFTSVIQTYTDSIQNEVSSRIGIESKISVPADMSEVFRSLVFITNDLDESINVPLDMRGDGIQSRHIPIILKYLADEDQKSSKRGAANITTIWGYEEPENGIELLRAFEVAGSFNEYSRTIQMFITTHSPAFYYNENHDCFQTFYVQKENGKDTRISNTMSHKDISQTIGLMPIIAPYIAEKQSEIQKLRMSIPLQDIPTIFVEGETDVKYLGKAIKILSPQLSELMDNSQLRIYSKPGEGGCGKIINWVLAWIYCGNKSKTYALFDSDSAGKTAHCELENNQVFKESKNNKARILKPNETIKDLLKKGIIIGYEIEHLLSVSFWEKMVSHGYVQERSAIELNEIFARYIEKDKSFTEICREVINSDDIRNTIVYYNPNDDKKDKIFKLLESLGREEQIEAYLGFQNVIDDLEKVFL